MAYITETDLARRVGIFEADGFAPEREAIVTAACRAVDLHCRRMFDVPSAASTRYFRPIGGSVFVNDIANTTDLAVTNDGTAVTLTDLVLLPRNGVGPDQRTGWPYVELVWVDGRNWATNVNEGTVAVTARWGWAATPDAVVQAALMVAADLWAMKDVRHGAAGFGEYGVMKLRENTAAVALLDVYRLESVPG